MKRNLSAVFILIAITFFSCNGQKPAAFLPNPDFTVYDDEKSITIEIGDIIETRNGTATRGLPDWLFSYIDGGAKAIEALDSYSDKYVFIGNNEGLNFTALSKWAENFATVQDFPILAAARIERRMIASASLYPDDEYGIFFETLIYNAYNGEYPGAVKEEIYWVRIRDDESPSSGKYVFFIMISINKMTMQTSISNMMASTIAAVTLSRTQASAVNRLRQNFFEGF
ncbi:MAG: hypothetical protein LBI28_00535 [Treponema sp.]|jgi:hypothetical protein|nr:hypothetical protein [Treponema sp.]